MSDKEAANFKEKYQATKALLEEHSMHMTEEELVYFVRANITHMWPKEEVSRYFDKCNAHYWANQIQIITVTRSDDISKKTTPAPGDTTASVSAPASPSVSIPAINLPILLPYHDSGIGKAGKGTNAVIGRDVEKNVLVTVGQLERCGGLYVLGQPRTGKSNLLVSLALSDIENGYGVLFIDPHTDAINDLLARVPDRRRDDIILLDPTLAGSSK
jgi:hypothetical protein